MKVEVFDLPESCLRHPSISCGNLDAVEHIELGASTTFRELILNEEVSVKCTVSWRSAYEAFMKTSRGKLGVSASSLDFSWLSTFLYGSSYA